MRRTLLTAAALGRFAIATASVGRLLIIGASSFGLATAASWQNHRGYWHGTIVRVQTTDFNILSHMLPTKLSYALEQGDVGELQRTLDSNYGLFGMVVTNCTVAARACPAQQIFYATNSKLKWRQDLQVENLSSQPYDLLRSPSPLLTERGFDHSRDRSWDATGRTNAGQIVGRVYYVRGVPPLFRNTYPAWLQKLPGSLLSDRGAERFYALTLVLFSVGGLASWGFVEWVFQRKRLQQRLAQQRQTQLVKEAQSLQHQLQVELQRQNALLAELEHYRQQETQLIQDANRSITHYEDQLAQREIEQQGNTTILTHLQHQLQQTQQQQVQGQAQLEQRERSISLLQTQIAVQQAENQRADASLKRLQTDLYSARQQSSDAATRMRGLDDSIAALTTERNLAREKAQQLERELKAAQTQSARSAQLANQIAKDLEATGAEIAQMQQHTGYLEYLGNCAIEENQQLNQRIQALVQEKAQLVEEQEDLQLQLWDREEELEWFQKQLWSVERTALPQPIPLVEPGTVQLSGLSLALVGGHSSVRQGVLKVLCENYGLQHGNYVEVPPTSEFNINLSSLREKIGNSDLVVVVTRYIGHDLTGMVSSLQTSGSLSGEVLPVNVRGRTGIVRSILAYVQKAGQKSTSARYGSRFSSPSSVFQ